MEARRQLRPLPSALPLKQHTAPPPPEASHAPDDTKSGTSTPQTPGGGKPPLHRHLSSPATILRSPSRHHKRTLSTPRQIKETLNAHLQYNEDDDRRINQYVIKQEIGRGSFGSVHLGIDGGGVEYAVKEFSKSRLRKQAHSHILRRGPQIARRGGQLNSPLHRKNASDLANEEENGNPLHLIQTEIAVMKKLNHENVVNLIEVLDDPDGDSLYMVLEMCAKGVIMKVGVDEEATPLDEEDCRYWFRDLILGIEYLHAQGIVHRDIKPDNLLLSADNVLKIVDFGVSEIFDKHSQNMRTSKSSGSPAFLPPEMCVIGHKDLDGKAVDIWSMGVTLFCLYYGHLPFDHCNIMELYEAIKDEGIEFTDDTPPLLLDLFSKIFEKDPEKRIKMPQLREHPWVTKNGIDTLLSEAENTAEIVSPPTEEEVENAITKGMRNVMAAVKAINNFKKLVNKRRDERFVQSIWGSHVTNDFRHSPSPMSPLAQPSQILQGDEDSDMSRSMPSAYTDDMRVESPVDMGSLSADFPDQNRRHSTPDITLTESPGETDAEDNAAKPAEMLHTGQEELADAPYLAVGDGDHVGENNEFYMVKSPAPAEVDIYETAYQEEVQRIKEEQGNSAKVYLTNRVDPGKKAKSKLQSILRS